MSESAERAVLARQCAAQRERRQRERERARAAQLEDIVRLLDRDRVAGFARLVDYLIDQHAINVAWIERPQNAHAVAAYKFVAIPRVTTEETAARALHELAHVLYGFCRHCAASTAQWSRCLECELTAARGALALSPVPFTLKMHQVLAEWLTSYVNFPMTRRRDLSADALRLCATQAFVDAKLAHLRGDRP